MFVLVQITQKISVKIRLGNEYSIFREESSFYFCLKLKVLKQTKRWKAEVLQDVVTIYHFLTYMSVLISNINAYFSAFFILDYWTELIIVHQIVTSESLSFLESHDTPPSQCSPQISDHSLLVSFPCSSSSCFLLLNLIFTQAFL